ncbi:MAG: ATP synthase F1 subunit gamma [Fimbriimonadaceae bacterium]|nr:ATP synthase F1 subunit gamma [Fimbriimonadaceae bacterium]
MATLKQIRQRIRTSKNIQQITRAMKLVAAARLNRAKNRVEEARPYSQKMREFMSSVGGGGDLPNHPLLQRRPIKRATLVLITSDRGLAGSYNNSLIRKASDFIREAEFDVDLITVGKKGNVFFSKRGFRVGELVTVPTAGAGLDDAVSLTNRVRKMYENNETDAVFLIYSRFYSPIRQVPEAVQVLPIEPPAGEESASSTEYEFEPDPEELLGLLLPKYLLTVVYQAMLESSASEHGARMTAMTSATDAAGKMIGELTLKANRARQAGITKEILEIVGGAEALKN